MGIQEHWHFPFGVRSCGSSDLVEGIQSTGLYKNTNKFHNYTQRPRGDSWNDTDGGLSIFSKGQILEFKEFEWGNSGALTHGVILARVRINSRVIVDVYNAHLQSGSDNDSFNDSSCGERCRRGELAQLRSIIKEHSATSGNPVIVMGDFNTGGPPSCDGNDGYGNIRIQLGEPTDLWLEKHPGEDGFTLDCLNNATLRDEEGSSCRMQERIDYIFAITDPELTNSRYVLVPRAVEIYAKETRPAGTRKRIPVSDHFGLEATIDIHDRGYVVRPLR